MHPRASVVLLLFSLLLSAGFSHGEEKWTHFLSGNDITDMAVCGDSLWCATRGSAVRWNIRNRVYTQSPYPFNSQYPTILVATGPDSSPWFIGSIFSAAQDSVFSYLQLNRYSGDQWIQSVGFNLNSSDNDNLLSLCCARNGDVWVGTNSNGALKFDGSSWKQFTAADIPLITPRVVAADDSGAVWIGTDDGLYRLSNVNWRRFSTQDGLAGNYIRCLLIAPNGALWAGTGSGASRFDRTGWKTYQTKDGLSSNGVNAMTADRAGKIWLGTDNGISCFDGATWTDRKGDAEYFIDKKVTGIAVDAANRIWMSHRGIKNGVTVLDGAEVKWYTTFNTDIPTNTIESVTAGSDGVLWFATDRGALRYDGVSWNTYATGDGLASNGVRDISVDRNNRPWFLFKPTENAGVTRLGTDGAVTFSTASGLPDNTVLSVSVAVDGAIWFGTRGGLARFDGHSWENYPDHTRLLSSKVSGIAEDPDGVLWFATDYGLSRFDGVAWRTYTSEDGLPLDGVHAVSAREGGTVWCMAGDDSLVRFKNGVFTAMPVPSDSLKTKFPIIRTAVDRDGMVWTDGDPSGKIVDAKRKVLYFDGVTWKTVTLPWPSTNTTITKIVVDKDNVKWFATDSGLVRLEGNSATVWQVDSPTNFPIRYMAVDRENMKWFFGGNFFLSYPITSSFDGKDGKNYPNANSWGSIIIDSRNRKWFADNRGLVCYDGNAWSELKKPSKQYLIQSGSHAIDANDVLWFVVYNVDTNTYELGNFDGVEWKMLGNGGVDLKYASKLMVDSAGTKWIIGNKVLVSFDGVQWKTYPEAPIPNDMAADRDGLKWFAYGEGVLSFDGKAWRKYTEANGLPYDTVSKVFVDRLNIKWFGAGSNLLSSDVVGLNLLSYDGTAWKIHDPGNGIQMGGVLSMAADMDNRKWIVWNYGNALSVLDDSPGADTGNIPVSFSLLGNYPNPFNAGTSIAFDLSARGAVQLSVYDILGRKVREMDAGKLPVGRNVIVWNGADDRGKRVSSGVYLYRVRFGDAAKTGRMLFLK